MDFLDTAKDRAARTLNTVSEFVQKRDKRLTEEAILYPFFFVAAVLAISVVVALFVHNESNHTQRVEHLEKLLNEARAEIRDDTVCAWGVKR